MKEIQTKSGKILIVEVPKDTTWWELIENNLGDFISKELSLGKKFLQFGKGNSTYYSPDKFYCVQNYKNPIILGKLSELTDKDCEELSVAYISNFNIPNVYFNFKDYDLNDLNELLECNSVNVIFPFESAKESFISLLQSEGVDISKEYLIINVL
jgi:hypothetical protein